MFRARILMIEVEIRMFEIIMFDIFLLLFIMLLLFSFVKLVSKIVLLVSVSDALVRLVLMSIVVRNGIRNGLVRCWDGSNWLKMLFIICFFLFWLLRFFLLMFVFWDLGLG